MPFRVCARARAAAPPRQVSVADYMRSRYGVSLQYPDLPCVLDRKGSALPLELLT